MSVIKKTKKYTPRRTAWRGDVVYDIEKLWKLTKDLDSIYIPIKELKWILNEDFWSNYEGIKNPTFKEIYITAMEVLKDPNISKYHANAIKNANLTYPILLIKLKNGKLDVIDGIHRLAKAYSENRIFIQSMIVPDHILSKAEIQKH